MGWEESAQAVPATRDSPRWEETSRCGGCRGGLTAPVTQQFSLVAVGVVVAVGVEVVVVVGYEMVSSDVSR